MARSTYFDLGRSADACPGSESGYAQRFQCGNIVKRRIWTRMMSDVPQFATIPLLNFVADSSLKLTPYFELVPFVPADKNLLFRHSSVFDGHREPDHHADFKLAGQFSN